jgi:hypothetical protein
MVYPALLLPMRTPRLPVVDWTDAPADLNGLVPFAERRNLLSARVPSHFKRSLTQMKRNYGLVLSIRLVPFHNRQVPVGLQTPLFKIFITCTVRKSSGTHTHIRDSMRNQSCGICCVFLFTADPQWQPCLSLPNTEQFQQLAELFLTSHSVTCNSWKAARNTKWQRFILSSEWRE